jgi:EmrB/QacA subfamily drug resistance transporter
MPSQSPSSAASPGAAAASGAAAAAAAVSSAAATPSAGPAAAATPSAAPKAPAQRNTKPGLLLTILCVAAFMGSLDVFIVNVAFADIGRDFPGQSLSNLSWILNGYAILYAAMLVPLGRLADRYGRKAGFVGGLALFTAASAACAASNSLWMLIAFRAVQAVGAAALTPTSLGLLLTATPPERRARAVRIWASSGALASAAGPAIGGLLVQASWRWVFIVNVPVGVVALIAAVRRVPDSRDTSVVRMPDLVGAFLLAIGIGALALGLVKGPDWGWGSTSALSCFAAAVVAVAVFWRRSLHHPSPVVEPALLRVRAFAWSNAAALLFSLAFGASLLGLVLWMQQVWGYSALRTGLAVAPGPLMVPIFAAVSQRLHHRVPAGRLTAVGCLAFGLGNVLFLTSVGEHSHYAAQLLPGWLLAGVGVGLALPTMLSSATAELPPERAATGSAVVSMSRQIGTGLGVSVLVAILGAGSGYADVHTAFQHAWWAIAGISLLAAVAAIGMTPPRERRASRSPGVG